MPRAFATCSALSAGSLRSPAGSRQHGFTYLGLLILVAILALATSATVTLGSIAQRREAEQRLLEVGDAYRRAIASYLGSGQSGVRSYPNSLADLLKDPRYPNVRRHLRQLYPDPITGEAEWGLILAPGGGIMGVHSLSDATPIKIAGFEAENQAFDGTAQYSQWRFVVLPTAAGAAGAAIPTATGRPGSAPAAGQPANLPGPLAAPLPPVNPAAAPARAAPPPASLPQR
jgi:type II secretory pathway pseudopilin PulG